MYIKKGVLGNFAKFTGKYLCQTLAQMFCCEFCNIFKNIFLQNSSRRLLLWKDRSYFPIHDLFPFPLARQSFITKRFTCFFSETFWSATLMKVSPSTYFQTCNFISCSTTQLISLLSKNLEELIQRRKFFKLSETLLFKNFLMSGTFLEFLVNFKIFKTLCLIFFLSDAFPLDTTPQLQSFILSLVILWSHSIFKKFTD